MNYKIAEFSWKSCKNPKGIVVFVPGSNQDGRDMLQWKPVKKWLKENSCIGVGCHFTDIDPSQIEGYADAKGGSGQALLDFIDANDIDNLPIFIWGFSAGGQFSYEFACFAPNRVKGFIVNKGGFYYTALAPPLTRQIPARFIFGKKDALSRQYIIAGICLMNKRDDKCPWELLQEDCDHEEGNSLKLGFDLFEKVLGE